MPKAYELFPDDAATQSSDSSVQNKSGKRPSAKELFPDDSSNDNKPLSSFSDLAAPIKETAKALPEFANAKIAGYKDLAAEDAKKAILEMQQRKEGVDYDTGLPMDAEIAYRRADTDLERFKALKKSFPDAAMTTDKAGNMIVVDTKTGKEVAAGTGGGLFSKRLPASLAASAEPIAGMAGGAELGAAAGTPLAPFTFGASVPIGAMIGAGIGGATGKGVQEIEKSATGYEGKDWNQIKDTLESEAGWSAGGEGVGRFLLGMGKIARQFPSIIGEQTAETNKLTEESLKVGAKPPVRAAAPGATKTSYTQTYIEKVIGNHREAKNATALENQIKSTMKSSGMSDKDAAKAFQELASGKVDSRVYGEEVSKNVKNYIDAEQKSVKSLNDQMSKVLDEQFKSIEKDIGNPHADLAGAIKTDIETARTTFSQAASTMYGKVDALVGNAPMVPTNRIKLQSQSIIDSLPTKKDGSKLIAPGAENVVKYLKDLTELPDDVSFRQAQFLRSEFNRMALPTDLTPGVDKKMFKELGDSVNGSFDDARIGKVTGKAADALKDADKFYKENIKKFKVTMASRLVKEAGTKGSVDPESVISLIAKPGYESRLRQIMKVTTPETQKAIVAEDFSQMVKKATNPVNQTISGKALLRQLNARAKTGDILYGKNFKEIESYAKRLAAKDGDIPIENLKPDNFTAVLKQATDKQAALDTFMKTGDNYLAVLAKNDFEFGQALNYIFQPGKEGRLEKAIEFFKEGSPIVQKMRQQGLVKIFSDAAGDSTETLGKALQGDKLEKELGKYTSKQLDMMFPNGLAAELKNMAKVVKFYSQESSKDKMAAGLAAGGTKLLPFFAYLPVAGLMYVADAILQKPSVIRWFGPGLYGDNVATTNLRGFFKNVPRAAIQSGAGTSDDE